jgi:hypothetical protein
VFSGVATFLSSDRGRIATLAVALLLGIATISIGFYADDWVLLTVFDGKLSTSATKLDLYHFASGDPVQTSAFVARGPWPWWTHPELKIQLWRPLASVLFTLDHALFGHAPLGYHLHAIAWWLGTVLAAGAIFRRALPPIAAAIALLLFVVDDAHVQPIGWISSRHMVVAAAPALFGLWAHLRAREEGWVAGRILGPLGAAVGLLGSEAALGVLGFWIAYELVGRRDARSARVRGAAPAVALGVLYVGAYKALGYGAANSGMYVEPMSDPIAFMKVALIRIPVLIGDLLLSVPADFSNIAPRAPFVALGLVAAVVVALLVRWAWPSLSEHERASVRWLGLGALFGILVGLAGFPGSRVLLVPSIGGFGVLGLLIDKALVGAAPAPRSVRAGGYALLFLHGVFALAMFGVQTSMLGDMARKTEAVSASLVFDGPLPKRVYILTGSDPFGPLYTLSVRFVKGPDDVDTWSILSMSKRTHRIERTGDRSLTVETEGGTFFDGGFVEVYRSRNHPLPAGTVVEMKGATVRVLSDQEGLPTKIELTLDVPFEDPSVALLAWQGSALRPVILEQGKPIAIGWSPGPTGFF